MAQRTLCLVHSHYCILIMQTSKKRPNLANGPLTKKQCVGLLQQSAPLPPVQIQEAASVFSIAHTPSVVSGRETEMKKLREFVSDSVTKNCGCLLVGGRPGCGKTAAVRHVMNEMRKQLPVLFVRAFLSLGMYLRVRERHGCHRYSRGTVRSSPS